MQSQINEAIILKHPVTYEQAYKGIGRKLTEADVGKSVVRTFPYPTPNGCSHNWRYIPQLAKGECHYSEKPMTLLAIENSASKIIVAGSASDDNDGNWLTVEEFRKFAKEDLPRITQVYFATCKHTPDEMLGGICPYSPDYGY